MEEEIERTLERVQSGFKSGLTKSLEYRLSQLRALCRFLTEQHSGLLESLKSDFKSHYEAVAELKALEGEIIKAIDSLASWCKDTYLSKPLIYAMDSCYMKSEPRGVALIIAPWNYPVDLLLEPLVGAISAGCAAILKPSEISVNTSAYLAQHLSKYLDSNCYAIVEGGVEETTELLEWPHWGLIFYTGNGRVGRIVQTAAAKNLIPTVLELGGKSPCIVTENVDLSVAAKRIVWGKFFNAGQTCVAPDYILLTDPSILEPFKEALLTTIKQFYGEDPGSNENFTRIVNAHHYERLGKLLEDQEQIITIGNSDKGKRSFAPTLVIEPDLNSPLMVEEIFGPILPIIVMKNGIQEAISFIAKGEKPLALYLFSNDSSQIDQVLNGCSSGGLLINDCMMHVFSGIFPLGGVGASGMGRYKGKWSFETFSHYKPVMHRSLKGEFLNDWTRNPPISNDKFSFLSKVIFSPPQNRHLKP